MIKLNGEHFHEIQSVFLLFCLLWKILQFRLKNLFLQYEEEIREDLKAISKGSKTSNKLMDQLYFKILYCLQPNVRKKIKIFSLDSDRDLDDTIFEAIIQGEF